MNDERIIDFDRGFGIGGLGRYEESYLVPTVPQIRCMSELEAEAKICRCCGQSEFDGAMFTTITYGDICDDCL